MLEQIVNHLVLEPYTDDPHPICRTVREWSELVLDYIPDDTGYRHGEYGETISDPYVLDLIARLETLPALYRTNRGVSLHKDPDTGLYYALLLAGRRRLWYEIPDRLTSDIDTLLTP